MPSGTILYSDQEYGTGDTLALAREEYMTEAIVAFDNELVFGKYVRSVPVVQGTHSYKFTAIADTEAEDLERGVVRTGSNQPESEGRVITLDTKQLIADHFQDDIADFLQHTDARTKYAMKDAHAVAKTMDKRLSALVSIGARVSARSTGADAFAGGKVVTATTTSTTLGTSYPRTLAGSRALQADFATVAQDFDEKDIPREGRIALVGPYLASVLLQDKTLVSFDYQGGQNDLLTRTITLVEGFHVIMTNNMADSDWSSYAQDNYASQTLFGDSVVADFSYVAAQFLGTDDAVGMLTVGNGVRPFGPDYENLMHGFYFGCKAWMGGGVLRPEACAEIIHYS